MVNLYWQHDQLKLFHEFYDLVVVWMELFFLEMPHVIGFGILPDCSCEYGLVMDVVLHYL